MHPPLEHTAELEWGYQNPDRAPKVTNLQREASFRIPRVIAAAYQPARPPPFGGGSV